jgi:cytochrome P450
MDKPAAIDAPPHDAQVAGPPVQPAGFGNIVISRFDDAAAVLRNGGFQREPRTPMVAAVLKAAGHDGNTLLRIGRLNLLNEDGESHQRKRRFAQKVIAGMAVEWQQDQIVAAYTELLETAVNGGEVDLHRNLSQALVCRMVGSRLGLAPEAIAVLRDLTSPIFNANFSTGLRMAEFVALAEKAENAGVLIDNMSFAMPGAADLDPDDVATLAVMVTVPAVPLLAEALTKAQLRLIADGGLLARLASQPELIVPFIRESLRLTPPLRFTKPMKSENAYRVPGGEELPAKARLVCDIARVNRDARRFEDPDYLDPTRLRRTDLSFGTGPHRCPGAGLSLVVIEHVIRTLIAGYDVQLTGEIAVKHELIGERHQTVPVRVRRRRT